MVLSMLIRSLIENCPPLYTNWPFWHLVNLESEITRDLASQFVEVLEDLFRSALGAPQSLLCFVDQTYGGGWSTPIV